MPEAENIKLGPNYIRLINRFWLKDLEVGFSHLEVHLYFKLLEVNNRLGWKKSFKYPNSRLGSEVGARQKNLIEARRMLIDCGLIRYEKGTTREAGVYQLLSEGVTKESNQESNEESNHGINNQDYDQKYDQKAEQKKVIRGALNKPNKNKQNKTNIPPSPPEKESGENWEKDFQTYLIELREAFKEITADREWIEKQESFNPGVDILKSIEKSCVNYWATEAGWKKKKGTRIKQIDWKSTFGNAVSQSMNRVYEQNKPNNQNAEVKLPRI